MEITQEFLDSTQYAIASILQYEAVYGEDFVAPGGRQTAIALIRKLGLAPGSRVLDVGCGLGGSAFIMAQEFGLVVEGIDLSSNMISLATEKMRKRNLRDKVSLSIGDCLQLDRKDYYDGIYSRDVFLHIHDKQRLFSTLRQALKKNGKLLFTDYCCGEKPWQSEFSDYVEDRGYCLHTLDNYAKLISEAGFKDVFCEDQTIEFINILKRETQRMDQLDLEQQSRIKLIKSWEEKIRRATQGDQRWGLFTARKPLIKT